MPIYPRFGSEKDSGSAPTCSSKYLPRMAFNALVLLFWVYSEREKLARPGMPEDEMRAQTIAEIIDAGTTVRGYAVLVLSRLSWRIVLDGFRIRPVRRLTKLQYAPTLMGSNNTGVSQAPPPRCAPLTAVRQLVG